MRVRGHLQHPAHQGFRSFCRVAGPLLLAGGITMIVIAIRDFESGFDDPFPRLPTFGHEERAKPPDAFWLFFAGIFTLMPGLWLTSVGFMGAAARYVAAETAPVATDTFNYVAHGAKEGVREIAAAVAEGVRAEAAPRTVLRCHKCDAENDADSKFCKSCGAALRKSVPCAACNEMNDADAKFCDNCGGKIG